MKFYLLKNAKGLSILFLIVALLLMITIGYVLSYLTPAKQKSVSLTLHSTKAFFLAQSGIEFAVRYAVANGWTTPATLDANMNHVIRNLGDRNGRFTVDYDRSTNKLTSIGVIPNLAERRIMVSNFASFLTNPKGIILDPRSPSSCWTTIRTVARFYIRNAREDDVTLARFSASWTQTVPPRRISRIDMNGVQRFSGNYKNGDPLKNLDSSQTINSDQAIEIVVTWSGTMTTCTNIVITFYPASGNGYTFYLDPAGGGLPSC